MVADAGIVDKYITAVPVIPDTNRPVKEHNTGQIWASSPTFGLVRAVKMATNGQLGEICIGDSVLYAINGVGDPEPRVGRVVGLAVGENQGEQVARVRRYMTTAEVVTREPRWRQAVPDGTEADAVWETGWYDAVGLSSVEAVVDVHLRPGDERILVLTGTVTDCGGWRAPYARPLASWEEPWMAIGGVRSEAVMEALNMVGKGYPIVNASAVIWSDGFQTFRRGTVSKYSLRTISGNSVNRL